MKVEIIIDRKHQITQVVMDALYQALQARLQEIYPDILIRVAHGNAMAMNITRASKEEREELEALVQSVWEEADSWMPEVASS
ncbi:DinI-like family protein [Aeromonas schubertii]|uniref:DinI-like family protein n=1 Tax=Aeromonas schubertii TaxID=652 RepID=UPI001CC58D44|nr:DinI-like family protein [Aeromonas schubertii]MBZ6072132.1 DinI family protein [Aeromonas schubertii]